MQMLKHQTLSTTKKSGKRTEVTLSRNKSSSQNQNITDDSSNSAETKSHNYEPKRRKQSTLESCLERSLSFEDGGKNMVAAVRLFLGKDHRIPCLAHCLNLIVDGVLKEISAFSALCDYVKRIIAKILATKSQTNKNTPDMAKWQLRSLKPDRISGELSPDNFYIASGRLASAVNSAVPDNRSRLTGEHIKERVLLMSIPDDYWFE
ncbi:hypothetical protein KQX54_012871 [Cotesia glomerata]|uniref:Uncharacterized protein n=1 Tax=Cotesia glomerata TaxID=32391 RepID=A0AAV7IET9_COTGL|nr:hypothetical protein KQX54_012871 [Cotesia glomerata]